MTKEEAIKVLEQIRQWTDYPKEALTMAIEALSQPSLTSELDEAAEEYVKATSVKVWGKIDIEKDFEGYIARAHYGAGLLDGFKACAEWMAGTEIHKRRNCTSR